MERKLKPIVVAEAFREKGIRLFSPEELRRIFGVSNRAAQEFIKDHARDLFVKLRNGLYALRADFPNELEIANRLYAPSYISFEYALSFYRVIPETSYTITSATTKITREFVVCGKNYQYSKIKQSTYTGYELMNTGETKTLFATPEKALVDYCYFADLGLKPLNERLDTRKLRSKEVIRYARLFERPSLAQLIRKIL